MKPEILAFAILPWSLFCIEMFLKSKNFSYIFGVYFQTYFCYLQKIQLLLQSVQYTYLSF